MVAEIWASVISPFVDQWVALKRKLINYTKNESQDINILKLRLPNGLKCCLNFFYCRNG